MVIYLKGPDGYRIAYYEKDAKKHEKDGYKRVDINAELAAKAKPRGRPPKAPA